MLLKNKFFIIVLLSSGFIFSQKINPTKNLILTVSAKGGVHGGVNTFYWLIPIDSIDIVKGDYRVYPLYLPDDLTNDNLSSCSKGELINLFVLTTQTNFDFDKTYIKETKCLESILRNNKFFVQKIKKKWKNKVRLKTKIFVTPVIGVFKYCTPSDEMKKRFDIENKIVIPISSFQFKSEYLINNDVKDLLNFTDFSRYSLSNRLQ